MKIGNQPLDKQYAELTYPVLNCMRKFHYDTLLNALLKRLNQPQKSDGLIDELCQLPWVVERLLLWLLADDCFKYRYCFNGDIDSFTLDQLIIYANQSISSLYEDHIKIHTTSLFVRQGFLSQMPYQKNLDVHDFVFQLYVIAKLDTNSKLRKYLNKRAGMPIDLYFQMALIFWKHTNQNKPWFDRRFINSMLLIFPETELNIFVKSFTSSARDLNKILSIRTVELDEWFQPVIFYKTPCILFDDAIIPFGRPTLRRYFENILGDWLEEENSNCLQDYDSMTENYVKAGLQRCNVNFLDEKGINQLTSSNDRVCDFMIDESDGFVLIEVKNKALTKKTPSSSHPVPITSKLDKTIISGINQLDITLAKLKTLSKFNHLNYYQIIVTKNDLWLGNANAFSSNSNDVDPVWLLTLSDMDHLIELVRDKRTTFCSFFKDLAARRKIPSESVFTVSMLLKKHPYKLNQIPSHLIVELDKLVDTIKSKTAYI